jgi:hypothetical protein
MAATSIMKKKMTQMSLSTQVNASITSLLDHGKVVVERKA